MIWNDMIVSKYVISGSGENNLRLASKVQEEEKESEVSILSIPMKRTDIYVTSEEAQQIRWRLEKETKAYV
jgi:hypothetical protein